MCIGKEVWYESHGTPSNVGSSPSPYGFAHPKPIAVTPVIIMEDLTTYPLKDVGPIKILLVMVVQFLNLSSSKW